MPKVSTLSAHRSALHLMICVKPWLCWHVDYVVGQPVEVEAAVHGVRTVFHRDDSEATLLVDASNAFNSLNCIVAHHNIRCICPALTTFLINTYRSTSVLYIMGDTLVSEEGITQGDPIATHMYALATLPFIDHLPKILTQVWYADDACACGSVTGLHKWYKHLCGFGPHYDYNVNATKTWLVVKLPFQAKASELFVETGDNLSTEGHPFLVLPLEPGTTQKLC